MLHAMTTTALDDETKPPQKTEAITCAKVNETSECFKEPLSAGSAGDNPTLVKDMDAVAQARAQDWSAIGARGGLC
jgi:hypothetical protein